MAKFEIAESITGKNEGGYANNPSDRGGETYAGIARKFWPNWNGWTEIDQIKSTQGKSAATINRFAKNNPLLVKEISRFYKANFWDANKLDQFNDQQIANTVYDFGVNAGTRKAAKVLQDVLGVTQDGIIGNQTIAKVNGGNPKAIYTAYNCKRKEYYQLLASNPTQHQFLNSWLSRLGTYT
jgi:lysozyme family protein